MESASALLGQGVDHPAELAASAATSISQLIVDTYLPRIHRFAVMVSPLRADPNDLTQEACVRALERAQQYNASRGTLDAWLWRIVVNLARDAGRASRRSELLVARLVQRDSATSLTSPEAVALKHIRDDALVAAVRRLPRRHRTVVAMRYGAGLSTVEIAECLGTTRMATAKTLRRALDRLRGPWRAGGARVTTAAELERTVEGDPLGDALCTVAVPVSSELRAAVRSRSHTRLVHRRRRRILTRTVAGTTVLCLVAFTPPGHALARLVLPDGLQQRLGLVEGAPRTLTPPGGARAGALPSHPSLSPVPCSAVSTLGRAFSGGVACYPDLSIAAAQATVDFHIATPALLPAALHYRGALTTGPHDVYLSWVRSDGHSGALALGIKDGAALPGGSAVPSGALQPVTVSGWPGYVVRGDYEDNGPGTAAHWNPNADDYELTWAHGGLTYDLTAGDLHLSVSDLVRIAESVS